MIRPLALVLLVVAAACAGPARLHLPPPEPLPFSNGVLVGDTLYLGGHLGLDPATRRAPEDPAEEARLMLEDFTATLADAGMEPSELVQVQVFCSDVSLYDTFNAVYRRFVQEPYPARAFVGSGTLLRGARFEILGVAVRR